MTTTPISHLGPLCIILLPAVILFEASMEFLENTEDEDEDEDEDALSFTTALPPPTFPPVAMETLPIRYNHTHREQQAGAVVMGGRAPPGGFDSALEDYYTLRLRGTHTRKRTLTQAR